MPIQDNNKLFHLNYFVHPLPALSIGLMFLNDHYLKYQFSSWWTGKLSDFMGVFYLPLFLVSLWCLSINLFIKPKQPAYINSRNFWTASIITALLMIMVNVNEGLTQWIELVFSRTFFSIRLTYDPTDLISLSSLGLSYWFAKGFFKKS